jgi:hypothetical protein
MRVTPIPTVKHPFTVSLGSSEFEHQTVEILKWWKINSEITDPGSSKMNIK